MGGVSTTSIFRASDAQARGKGLRDLTHLKSYVIDGQLLRTGSVNWSSNRLRRARTTTFYIGFDRWGLRAFKRITGTSPIPDVMLQAAGIIIFRVTLATEAPVGRRRIDL